MTAGVRSHGNDFELPFVVAAPVLQGRFNGN
jgi:hypothetical protein